VTGRRALLALVCLAWFAAPARADDDPVARWGITIWGLSWHRNDAIDYDEHNWGAGLRYYLRPHLFVEGDVLRNSNRGIVVPASIGFELGIGSIGACHLSAVGAAAVAYYQNLRTNADEIKVGPVPGLSVRCGRVQPNVIAVLSPSRNLLAAVVGSVTIVLPPRPR
jgi:hypothetical protein